MWYYYKLRIQIMIHHGVSYYENRRLIAQVIILLLAQINPDDAARSFKTLLAHSTRPRSTTSILGGGSAQPAKRITSQFATEFNKITAPIIKNKGSVDKWEIHIYHTLTAKVRTEKKAIDVFQRSACWAHEEAMLFRLTLEMDGGKRWMSQFERRKKNTSVESDYVRELVEIIWVFLKGM